MACPTYKALSDEILEAFKPGTYRDIESMEEATTTYLKLRRQRLIHARECRDCRLGDRPTPSQILSEIYRLGEIKDGCEKANAHFRRSRG